MKKKVLVLLFSLALILSSFTLPAMAADTNEEAPTLSFYSCGLTLQDSVAINFKVSHSNLSAADARNIKVLIWDTIPESFTKANNPTATLSNLGTVEGGYEYFRYTGLAAKDMTKEIYFCAYVKVGEEEIYSEVRKYSVLTYAYNKINAGSDTNLVNLCKAVLNYGAAAQTYLGYNTDFLANATVYKVSVTGGTLDDGFTSGIYKSGSTVTLTADAPKEGYRFSHWMTSNGGNGGMQASMTIAVNKAESYTAIYTLADEAPASAGLGYTIDHTKNGYLVWDNKCTDTNIVIPSVYNGLPVIGIGYNGFDSRPTLKNITIPGSVTAIDYTAFKNCPNLESITIPDGVTTINYEAFQNCYAITSIVLPDSLTTIGKGILQGCTALKNVKFPANITAIPASMFYGSGIEEIEIPESVTVIKYEAFRSCESLTTVTMSNGVTSIEGYSFANCIKLTTINFAGTTEEWKSITFGSGWNYSTGNYTVYCTDGTIAKDGTVTLN